ncbi:MAG TPA: carboxypeptidase-like regulatory domain-containing protein, partial [Thermoanaerobaculia bacterium]|nr:carboxypeptidase-like regulatory domain-containing protein [Thermoanaerobaculia bacterium]
LEEGSNAAVFGAVITVQGMTFTADSQGVFNITGLAAGATTVRIERWGFEATTRTLTLVAGSNALGDVSLVPRPVVTLTETDGTTHRLDFDSVEFASAAPLSNYIPLSPAEFCRLDGTVVEYDKAEIATLAGPGVEASGACCPPNNPGLQITLTLKSGESFPAILRMCEFYKLDFIGRSRDTGQWVYRDFTKIAQIQFP